MGTCDFYIGQSGVNAQKMDYHVPRAANMDLIFSQTEKIQPINLELYTTLHIEGFLSIDILYVYHNERF
jgi:hypothetical protein